MIAAVESKSDRSPYDGVGIESVTLSIIISTYNAREILADCLQSIYENPPSLVYEIIVVDDASTDDTSGMVRERFPSVRLLRNEVNRHYASSNNRAIDHACGQYLYLLNNDTIMLPHALDQMVEFLREHPDVGAVGSMLLNGDGTIQWSVKSLPGLGAALFGARSLFTRMFPNNRFSRKHLLHLKRNLTEPFIAGYVSSASVMMPRKVVADVGELDRRLSYHVDADYCKRIADAGYSTYYLPAAKVIHLDHKGGTMVDSRRRFRSLVEFHGGSYIYYRKHIQRSPWSAMQVVVIVGLFSRFVVSTAAQIISELVGSRSHSRIDRTGGAAVVSTEGQRCDVDRGHSCSTSPQPSQSSITE
jgi:hypothetical protein